MIEYFTALVISYSIQSYDIETQIWFETEGQCQHAFQYSGVIDPLYEHLYEVYGNDIMISCYVSDNVSKKPVRPKARPKNVGS